MIAQRRARAIENTEIAALLRRLALLAAALVIIFTFGFLIAQVSGQGMFPAMKDGDLVVVFRTPAMRLTGQALAQDDIIAYQYEGRRYYARVVAVAGDQVTIGNDGSVSVNGSAPGGEIMYPTYVRGSLSYPLTVPENTVFVLGDYRTNTLDSRDHGLIPLENVEGRVISLLRRRGL